MEDYKWKTAVSYLGRQGYRGEREDKSGPLICEMLPKIFTVSRRHCRSRTYACEMIMKELIRSSIYFPCGSDTHYGEPDLLSGTVRKLPPVHVATRNAQELRATAPLLFCYPRAMLPGRIAVIRERR